MYRTLSIAFVAWTFPCAALAASAYVLPAHVLQGEPALVVASSSAVSVSFEGSNAPLFSRTSGKGAFLATSLTHRVGTTTVRVMFADGAHQDIPLVVRERPREVEPLGIPAQFGGTTSSGAKTLVSSLARDNALLAALTSHQKTLWRGAFGFPLAKNVVSDPYGYVRQSAGTEIAHKGTDFVAPSGTRVYAMNRGVVRLAKKLTTYGTTVVIDHGQGVLTMYMHLSKAAVAQGQLVAKAQYIGMSGETGYSEGPHLHVSVRIGGVSVDPVRFVHLGQ